MMKKFNFDYDKENDSLFLFNPKTKSNSSIEIDNLIIDYNNKKQVSAIELLNASNFFNNLNKEIKITKKLLNNIKDCKIEIKNNSNFFILKFLITFNSKKQICTPLVIPTIKKTSPALAY